MIYYGKSQLYWIKQSYKLVRRLGTGLFFICVVKESTHFSHDQDFITVMAAIIATKKVTPAETEEGVPLAPLAKDLKPWYSVLTQEQPAEEQDEKRFIDPIFRERDESIRERDESRKYVHDPLTNKKAIGSSSFRPPLPSKANHDKPPEEQVLLSQSTERGCALELVRLGKTRNGGQPNSKYCI